MGASGSVMVSKLDLKTYTSEFESHWVPHSYGLVPHLSKKLSKLPPQAPYTGHTYLKVYALITVTSKSLHTHLKVHELVTPTQGSCIDHTHLKTHVLVTLASRHMYWTHSPQGPCTPTSKSPAYPPQGLCTGHTYINPHVLIKLTSTPMHNHLKSHVLVTPTLSLMYWLHSSQGLWSPTSRYMQWNSE